MEYRAIYHSPLGAIYLSSRGDCLISLSFNKPAQPEPYINPPATSSVLSETYRWLDLYFSDQDPGFTPKYKIENATSFRRQTLEFLAQVPYGALITYGDLARGLAALRGLPKMSAQAVGNAVGWNPICLIIPCHRVIGANRKLVGYSSGGIAKKRELLALEGHNLANFS